VVRCRRRRGRGAGWTWTVRTCCCPPGRRGTPGRAQVIGWTGEQTIKRVNKQLDGKTNNWMCEQTNGCVNKQLDGKTNIGWENKQFDE